MDNTLKPFLVRLRPRARVLLDRAAEVELRSRASVIDELICTHLETRYSRVDDRLDQMLGSKERHQ
jgi:hypothetical protein